MDALARDWLALHCRLISGAFRGVLLLGPPGRGPFVPAAWWPEGAPDDTRLADAAQEAMAERRGVLQPQVEPDGSEPTRDAIALPLLVDGQVAGALAVEVPTRPKAQHRGVIQVMQWSCASLALLLRERWAQSKDRLVTAIELVGTALEHERFQAAATTVTTELAMRLACDRVSLGFVGDRRTRLRAISHSASFASRANLVRDLEAAMDEAVDQTAPVVYPAPEDDPGLISRAHEQLASRHAIGSVCSLPLTAGGRVLGCLTLERGPGQRFGPEQIELCEHVAALVGPILELKRKEDRWLGAKAREAARTQLTKLLGPGHLVLKLGALCGAGLLAYLTLATGDYRVTANASLEGEVQRVVVAAVDGYVATAYARAGETVQEGELLAALDDRDLSLERRRLEGQREQLRTEQRGALARHDRTELGILNARLAQTDAQIGLLDEQLARTRLVAPFDGVIVAGDLSQSLGSPVERGQVLFEVAPLDGYRIILEVDERDVSALLPDQRGKLALSALPGQRFPLVVDSITPVSTAEEGSNVFRVEARLEQPSELLRPGMEGVAKIEVDRRSRLWIWTHGLVDRLRLWAWTWWP